MRAEVVQHDADPSLGRVQAAEVSAEPEEGAATLVGLDVAVDLVGHGRKKPLK